MRAYRERKYGKRPPKGPPKTAKQRVKEYRERLKLKKLQIDIKEEIMWDNV